MKTSIVKQRNSALSYNHKTIKAVNRLMNNPLQIIPKRYLLSMLQMSSNDPENETTTIEVVLTFLFFTILHN